MILVICLTAFVAALLTFFSGFGLGTLLSPVFMLFFPVDISIALTGIVHFFNNLFKLALMGKMADRGILVRFGIPSVLAAMLGAWLLMRLSGFYPLYHVDLFGHDNPVSPLKFTVALLLMLFAAMELIPALEKMRFSKDKLIIGGALSGFFGGLTGNQGALRSAFLINAGLSKDAYLGTAVVVSSLVDFTRIGIYASQFKATGISVHWQLLTAATLSAMTGAFIGNKLFKKVTMGFVRYFVAIFLLLIAIGLGTGLI
ncbi:MAG: TSUP family transporter [Bacteroidota bacterium]